MNSYSLAERINSDVNASVKYKTDLEQYGVPEFWTVAGKYGDCEDYALLKRKMLIDAGFDRDKIHLCTCFNDHIISWSNEGDIVFDPFMGSGTTAKMAILNKRNWIGSEISEEYCKIIERRITTAST